MAGDAGGRPATWWAAGRRGRPATRGQAGDAATDS
jgi:hypothetical protein